MSVSEFSDGDKAVRHLQKIVNGMPTSDGGGVSLLRVIGTPMLDFIDPFLMLDEFKNTDPDAYVAGFPDHPHRGFETVSYMKKGRMRHRDSVGNEGVIHDGGVQWMTAGRGVIHSEMPEQNEGMLWGYQLWVNLPAAQKMVEPSYQDIQSDGIPEITANGLTVRIMAGQYAPADGPVMNGASQTRWPVSYMDVMADANQPFTHQAPDGHNALIFVYEGSLIIDGETIQAHQLAVLGRDGIVSAHAGDKGAGFLLMTGQPIGEPVAKMGPFVMNTQDELRQAVMDFRAGRFA